MSDLVLYLIFFRPRFRARFKPRVRAHFFPVLYFLFFNGWCLGSFCLRGSFWGSFLCSFWARSVSAPTSFRFRPVVVPLFFRFRSEFVPHTLASTLTPRNGAVRCSQEKQNMQDNSSNNKRTTLYQKQKTKQKEPN